VGLGLSFGDLGFGFGPGGSLIERFFGPQRSGPPMGRDIEVDVPIPLSRVMTGGEEKVAYTRTSSCRACRGAGAKDGARHHPCAACQGTGQREVWSSSPRQRRPKERGSCKTPA
jgi:molecular chaperone DnaJ